MGAAAVAADDVERAAGKVGDAAAGRHGGLDRPARQRDRAGRRDAPANLPVGDVHGDEARARRQHGVGAVRREIAVARGPERAHAAARADRVGDAAPEREDDAARQLHGCERGAITARRVVAQMRRDRDGTGRREGGQQRPDDPRHAHAPPAGGRALREGREHEPPAALAGLDLAGGLEPQQARAQELLVGVHASTVPASSSRARRSRELTVPRGRSSMSAISPGVCSSR